MLCPGGEGPFVFDGGMGLGLKKPAARCRWRRRVPLKKNGEKPSGVASFPGNDRWRLDENNKMGRQV